jgi:hypothetical protein
MQYTGDWVVSLGVGEHIAGQYEDIYMDNVVKNSRNGCIVSWGGMDDGGHGHVNLKPEREVLKLFESRGFEFMEEETNELRREVGRVWWLKRTLYVFGRLHFNDANSW